MTVQILQIFSPHALRGTSGYPAVAPPLTSGLSFAMCEVQFRWKPQTVLMPKMRRASVLSLEPDIWFLGDKNCQLLLDRIECLGALFCSGRGSVHRSGGSRRKPSTLGDASIPTTVRLNATWIPKVLSRCLPACCASAEMRSFKGCHTRCMGSHTASNRRPS